MKIPNSGPVTPDVAAGTARATREALVGPSTTKDGATAAEAEKVLRDSVELSAEGQALAQAASLPAERLQEIRQKILEGAYDAAGVADAVARRILKSGDV